VDVCYDKDFRINKTKLFIEKMVHINGIEVFWSFTKRCLSKFNGVMVNFKLTSHYQSASLNLKTDEKTNISQALGLRAH